MLIDFSTILFLASMITFIVWLTDAYFWQEKRDAVNNAAINAIGAAEDMGTEVTDEQRDRMLKAEHPIVEVSKAFFPILAVVLILRSFVFEPFRIPSPSMEPTLLAGDFILVNKSAFGFRLPVVNHRMGALSQPKRGDVTVFRFPFEPTTNYIKRLIGLPGDVIEFKDKKLIINGEALAYRYAGIYRDKDGITRSQYERRLRKETIGDREHDELTRVVASNGPYACLKDYRYTVKKGEYFVIGDNRDNSWDSRFWCGVPEKNLVGKAYAIWMNWDPYVKGFWKLRTERVFTKIK